MPVQRKRTEFVAVLDRLLGIPEDEALGWIAQSLFTLEGGAAAASRLLAQGATAIVCGSDLMALGAIQAVRRAGLSVPGDVSVVGYDDSPLVAFVDPPLTTIRQSVQAMGVAAVDAVVEAINGTPVPPHEYVFRPELVLRGSTAVAPALTPKADPCVCRRARRRHLGGSWAPEPRTSPCVSRTARSIAPTWAPPRSGRRTPRRGSAPAASPVVAGGSTPGSRKRQRPGPCAQDPVHHPVAVRELSPVTIQVLQPGRLIRCSTLGVAGLPSGGPVVRAVELADDAGLRVEQVSHPEQPTVEVPDLLIDQGRRQPDVKRRPAAAGSRWATDSARWRKLSAARTWRARSPRVLGGVRPHLPHRDPAGRRHHVHRDDRGPQVVGRAHRVEQRPRPPRAHRTPCTRATSAGKAAAQQDASRQAGSVPLSRSPGGPAAG